MNQQFENELSTPLSGRIFYRVSCFLMFLIGLIFWVVSLNRIWSEGEEIDQPIHLTAAHKYPFTFQGTVIGSQQKLAIINHQVYREGQKIFVNQNKYHLLTISDQCIKLIDGKRCFKMYLKADSLIKN